MYKKTSRALSTGAGVSRTTTVRVAASLVLLVFSVTFNLGMSIVRTHWAEPSSYLPGAADKASLMQGGIGALCVLSAVVTLLLGDDGATGKQKSG